MNLFTRKEAAQQLGISTSVLDEIRMAGQIGYVQRKANCRVFFRQSDLDTYLARCTHQARPERAFVSTYMRCNTQ